MVIYDIFIVFPTLEHVKDFIVLHASKRNPKVANLIFLLYPERILSYWERS